jgi:hypothetical protein
MRENRTYGSEGGEGESLSLPLYQEKVFGEAAKTAMLARYAGHYLIIWIPARE